MVCLVKRLLVLLAAAMVLVLEGSPGRTQNTQMDDRAVKVVTRVIPPFVIKQGGEYTGFSAKLMQAIAQQAGFQIEWIEVKNISEILQAVETGQADVAIGAISITSEREKKFDFSQPMFESGLQVLVRSESDTSFGFGTFLRILSTGALPALLAALAGLVLIPAHVVWLAERKHENPLFSRHYYPGIFHAMWWAVGATAGQQPDIPRSSLGRFLSAISILISVIFMAFFTAALTASVTVGQLQGSIRGIGDLPGKRIVTTRGSTSAAYLTDHNVQKQETDDIRSAIKDLEEGRADAVVFDAPVLQYYAANEGNGRVKVVGQVFKRENYGLVFQQGSLLRKHINESLLKMREDGTYDILRQQWFAGEQE
jgi:polar amino acid transport system substrate-binding protein